MMQFHKTTRILLTVAIVVSVAWMMGRGIAVADNLTEKNDALVIETNKGDPVPEFTLENMKGEKVSMNDFRGGALVLGIAFFPEGEKAIRNMEEYRKSVISDFKGKRLSFLKVLEINKPVFMKKKFILSKMAKQLEGIPGAQKNTLIDWGGALNLYEKFGIKDRKVPALFVIGKEGEIVYAFQGWHSMGNQDMLNNELKNIVK
ncbi:MAG: redoxin domain-containing protein [Desulfobacteraceae bacterium]